MHIKLFEVNFQVIWSDKDQKTLLLSQTIQNLQEEKKSSEINKKNKLGFHIT